MKGVFPCYVSHDGMRYQDCSDRRMDGVLGKTSEDLECMKSRNAYEGSNTGTADMCLVRLHCEAPLRKAQNYRIHNSAGNSIDVIWSPFSNNHQ